MPVSHFTIYQDTLSFFRVPPPTVLPDNAPEWWPTPEPEDGPEWLSPYQAQDVGVDTLVVMAPDSSIVITGLTPRYTYYWRMTVTSMIGDTLKESYFHRAADLTDYELSWYVPTFVIPMPSAFQFHTRILVWPK
jgi:hypothetical protein